MNKRISALVNPIMLTVILANITIHDGQKKAVTANGEREKKVSTLRTSIFLQLK
jgi:hypothetical protein